jgi:hypothetical protein
MKHIRTQPLRAKEGSGCKKAPLRDGAFWNALKVRDRAAWGGCGTGAGV